MAQYTIRKLADGRWRVHGRMTSERGLITSLGNFIVERGEIRKAVGTLSTGAVGVRKALKEARAAASKAVLPGGEK